VRYFKSLAAVILAFSISSAHASDQLVLGVQDYEKSPRVLADEFKGLAEYLSAKLGQPVRVQASQSYKRYMANSKKKRYAFIYGPPSMAMDAYKAAGYEPVVKIPGVLSASFMTLSTSDVAFPEDMKGKRIGMPDEDSMMTKLALAKLRSMKINPDGYFSKVQTFNDASDVISALKLNLIDIGVANSSLLNVWTGKGHNLNVVLTSDPAPHLTFSVNKDLPADVKAKVTQAMLEAHKDPKAASYFKNSGFQNFEPASLKDYQKVLTLK